VKWGPGGKGTTWGEYITFREATGKDKGEGMQGGPGGKEGQKDRTKREHREDVFFRKCIFQIKSESTVDSAGCHSTGERGSSCKRGGGGKSVSVTSWNGGV